MSTKKNETISSSKESISIKNYFRELRSLEQISGDEQVELAKKAQKGDRKALNKLVESNLRFVVSVSKDYLYSGVPLEDLISEGNLGLIKAIDKYDASKGFKFISYAVWWIRQSIMQSIYEEASVVRLPVNKINSLNKINRAKETLLKELEREPTPREISKLSKVPEKEIKSFSVSGNFSFSIDDKISEDSDSSITDTLEGEGLEEIEGKLNKSSLISDIDSVLSKLSKREADIIRMYFGLGEYTQEMTLKEIGKELSLTNERVRQLKETALRRLRMHDKSSKLREFLNCSIK